MIVILRWYLHFWNKGGSHEIATSITDLHGAAFRTDLVSWLKSIPYFPKPFDMVFEPITSLMYHLLDDLVAGDCYQAENLKFSFCFTFILIIHSNDCSIIELQFELLKTCIVEKEEFCIKKRESKVSCLTNFGKTSPLCKDKCKDAKA